jgi:hypothetical protein
MEQPPELAEALSPLLSKSLVSARPSLAVPDVNTLRESPAECE